MKWHGKKLVNAMLPLPSPKHTSNNLKISGCSAMGHRIIGCHTCHLCPVWILVFSKSWKRYYVLVQEQEWSLLVCGPNRRVKSSSKGSPAFKPIRGFIFIWSSVCCYENLNESMWVYFHVCSKSSSQSSPNLWKLNTNNKKESY